MHTLNDDDDFAELGLPVERVGGVIAKLMTERPQPFVVSILDISYPLFPLSIANLVSAQPHVCNHSCMFVDISLLVHV